MPHVIRIRTHGIGSDIPIETALCTFMDLSVQVEPLVYSATSDGRLEVRMAPPAHREQSSRRSSNPDGLSLQGHEIFLFDSLWIMLELSGVRQELLWYATMDDDEEHQI